MIALITAALSILAIVLEIIAQNKKGLQEKRYEEIQSGRDDIVRGDSTALSNRIDRMLSVSESNQPSGSTDPADVERRLRTVVGISPE